METTNERAGFSLAAFLRIYTHPSILAILCLGFVSGLPLALTGATLGAWLSVAGIDKTAIGLFASVATPYALKFLWSPLIDSISFPILCRWLGRRRGWMIATQLGLIASLLLLGMSNPAEHPWWTALFALMVAICSASQDIVIDAYRVEILAPEQQGAGAATIVLGYRFGMIASSAGALFLASSFGWMIAYWVMASLIGIGIVTVLLAGEPRNADAPPMKQRSFTQWFKEAVIAPFADFMTREQWLVILLFILFYKFGDAFMGVMTNPFLIEIGFTLEQIATYVKLYGLIATIVGSFIGGAMIYRLGVTRSLWICGIAQALTNLMFMLQAQVGADTAFLALTITLENLSGGMGTAAFVAFMSNLCNLRFTATQYALLSSFAATGRTWLSTPAGWFAQTLGWQAFFLLATVLAVPGLVMLYLLTRKKTTVA